MLICLSSVVSPITVCDMSEILWYHLVNREFAVDQSFLLLIFFFWMLYLDFVKCHPTLPSSLLCFVLCVASNMSFYCVLMFLVLFLVLLEICILTCIMYC